MVYLLNYIATGVCYETVHTHGLSIGLYTISLRACNDTAHTHGLSIKLYSYRCML